MLTRSRDPRKLPRIHVYRESSPAAIVDHAAFTLAQTRIYTGVRDQAQVEAGAPERVCWRNRLISRIPAIKVPSPFTAIARDLPVMRVVR